MELRNCRDMLSLETIQTFFLLQALKIVVLRQRIRFWLRCSFPSAFFSIYRQDNTNTKRFLIVPYTGPHFVFPAVVIFAAITRYINMLAITSSLTELEIMFTVTSDKCNFFVMAELFT